MGVKEILNFDSRSVLIIYGAGMVGKLAAEVISRNFPQKDLYIAVTKKSDKTPKMLEGVPVREISELDEYRENAAVLIATLPDLHEEIGDTLSMLGFRHVIPVDEELYEEMCSDYIEEHNSFIPEQIEKYDRRILFVPSDNNATSGAFLAMAELCELLLKHNTGCLVVLPHYGTGEKILQERQIPYVYVRSMDWCIPSSKKEDFEYRREWYSKYQEHNEKAILQISDLIRKRNISLVHSNTTYSQIGILAAEKAGVPCIWHFREHIRFQEFQFFEQNYANRLIDKADKKVFISEYLKKVFDKDDDKKAIVLHDVVEWKNRYKRKILLTAEPQLVIVGAINENKSQIDLIKACKILRDSYELAFHLKVVGKGEKSYLSKLQKYVNENNLESFITFCGSSSDVRGILEESDIAFMCSKSDSFGRVTVEGQLAGCLVIGARAGATGEIITDKKTGILYEVGNYKELAEKIREAIIDKERSRKIAADGQEYAWNTYSSEKYYNSIKEIYDSVLG